MKAAMIKRSGGVAGAVKLIRHVTGSVNAGDYDMANSLKTNPIVIDTVSSDVDISGGHTEVTNTTMYVEAVRFEGSTAADVVVLKDTKGNVIVSQTSPAGGGDLDRIDLDGFPAQGLKVLAADCTISSGNFKIWLR